MNTFDISCIIVTYENSATITECLNSVIADLRDLTGEIIVIDNASQDETVANITSIREKHTIPFRLIDNRNNVGFSRAVNQGLCIADGTYILLLNPDTVVHPGFFRELVTFLEANPTVGIVAPKQFTPDGIVLPSCREFPAHLDVFFSIIGLSALFPRSKVFNGWKMGYFDHNSSLKIDQPMGACILLRREDIHTIGYLDERFWLFFSDVDLCKRFFNVGKSAYFISTAYITHIYGHSIRKNPVRMIMSSHWAFNRYFWKYYRRWYWFIPNVISGCELFLCALGRISIALIFGRKRYI